MKNAPSSLFNMYNEMKKVFLLFVTIFTIAAQQMMAVPASPVKRMVKLADNSTVELTLRGDEDFHFWQAQDGRVFVEKKGQYIQMKTEEIDEIWSKNRRVRGEAFNPRNASSRAKAKRRASIYTGKKKGLVILVNFADKKMVKADPQAYYNDFFNKENYTTDGFTGSVHDYFKDQSYGTFDLEFDVVGPVDAKFQMSYYGQNDENGRHDINVSELIPEVCKAVDNNVNFKDYDWDGNGIVDQVFIIYAGYGEAQGAPSETIWPHESTIDYKELRLDGVNIATYAVACELRGASGSTPDGVGTACHEFSHCMGLHDMYDTSYSGGWGTGNWDLLCSGSYNNSSRTPPSYTSYEKMVCGWLEPKELSARTTVNSLEYIGEAPDAYIMYNDGKKDEYYLLENRQAQKWDAPIGANGMLVLHVDYDEMAWNSNDINTNPAHQRIAIVPADGKASSYDMKGDVYPGTNGNNCLSRYSSPAATVFNANTDGSFFLNKNVVAIAQSEDGVISFEACVPELNTPVLNTPVEKGAGSFTLSWEPESNADFYEIKVEEFAKEVKTIEESVIINEDFSKCYAKTAGFTDISNKLSSYLNSSGFIGSKLYCTSNYLRFGTTKDNGYLYTPYFYVRESGNLTYAIRVELFDKSTPVDAQIMHYRSSSDKDVIDLEISEDGWIIDNVSKITKEMCFGFFPESRIYLNHLMVLEGTWSKEDIAAYTKKKARRKANVHEFTTETNSFTFEDMNVKSIYNIKVRACNNYLSSLWSEETTFSFSPEVAIESISASDDNSATELFDVYGRKADSSSKGIVILRQKHQDGTITTKKVIRR